MKTQTIQKDLVSRKLQAFNIQNFPYDREHLQYKITIPKNISNKLKLKDGQIVYIKNYKKSIEIHLKKTYDGIPIKISKNLTRIYKGEKNYTTRICIPLEIIDFCKLVKQDNLYFESEKSIITMFIFKK